jgi:hypothetical protein
VPRAALIAQETDQQIAQSLITQFSIIAHLLDQAGLILMLLVGPCTILSKQLNEQQFVVHRKCLEGIIFSVRNPLLSKPLLCLLITWLGSKSQCTRSIHGMVNNGFSIWMETKCLQNLGLIVKELSYVDQQQLNGMKIKSLLMSLYSTINLI